MSAPPQGLVAPEVFPMRFRPWLAGALLALLFAPLVLSSDLYRYIWDGRVQRAGINPYLYPPSAPELAVLRDEHVYPRINRP